LKRDTSPKHQFA